MKLNPQQTADALPYPLLAQEIERLLGDSSVVVPPRLVQRLSDQSSLFVMPASDAKLAITKLITPFQNTGVFELHVIVNGSQG